MARKSYRTNKRGMLFIIKCRGMQVPSWELRFIFVGPILISRGQGYPVWETL